MIMSTLAGPASASTTSTVIPASSLGYDISFPQCGSTHLPVSPGFGIVGVNDGHPFSANPCLASELQWSQSTLTGQANFYTNVDDPGPTQNSSWPTNQASPQSCSGANSPACAYDYGWNAAQGSFNNAVAAEGTDGSPAPLSAATTAHWWLDIETGNAWEALGGGYGPTSSSYANDQAVVHGELAYFASASVTAVGIYSTGHQWNAIMGNAGNAFASTQAWVPGYATVAQAQIACASPSFLGGRVSMIQYPSNGLDGDFACGLISGPTSSSSAVANASSFSAQLSVVGENSPISYAQTAGAPTLLVSPTGLVTVGSTLSAGAYVAAGTTTDTLGNSGTFSFTLVVGVITQSVPTSASSSAALSPTFSAQLAVTGSDGTTTFTQTTGAPKLLVSPTGLVTTNGALAPGSYTLSGTTLDRSGDNGSFSFSLVVGAIVVSTPLFSSIGTDATSSFTHQLVVTGANGPVTFSQTTGAPTLLVSPTGLVTTNGALAAGSYVVRGTTADTSGDKGKFFFNLRVSALAVVPIVVSAPLFSSISADVTSSFTHQLVVSGANGPVTFSQTTGAPNLLVSSTGLITTSSALAPGSYVVRGTTADTSGDKGTFFFNLRVSTLAATTTTTTTTVPKVTTPVAQHVIGYVVPGRTVTLFITGQGFYGRPKVTSHPGTTAFVTKDTGTTLTVRVSARRGSRNGTFTFTVVMANAKTCRVRYIQHG